MQDAKERPVLLVGSVPLGSSRAVFEAVGTKLGKLVKRIPDGEARVSSRVATISSSTR